MVDTSRDPGNRMIGRVALRRATSFEAGLPEGRDQPVPREADGKRDAPGSIGVPLDDATTPAFHVSTTAPRIGTVTPARR